MFQVYNSTSSVFTIPCQVSFPHHLSFLTLPLPPTPLPSGNHHIVICVHGPFIFSLPNPFTLLTQPPTAFTLTFVGLFSVFLTLSLFCQFIFFPIGFNIKVKAFVILQQITNQMQYSISRKFSLFFFLQSSINMIPVRGKAGQSPFYITYDVCNGGRFY